MRCVCNLSTLSVRMSGEDCAHLPVECLSAYESSVRFFSYWAFYFYSRTPKKEDARRSVAA